MQVEKRKTILEVRDLSVSFRQYERGTRQVMLPVISGLNVTVREGEIVAVAGSSGSGKSLLAHAVLGLLPSNAYLNGEIRYRGELLDEKRKEQLRGAEIALVPQSVSYLDPLMKIGKQVRGKEPGYRRTGPGERAREADRRKQRQRELFIQYELPEDTEKKYPHACSGGMSRRILLAAAMMDHPGLILADEPTPGLDPELAERAMADLRTFADTGGSVLLITHDLELALRVADRIVIFYAGTTLEEASASDFASEDLLRHPYTRALWRAMPRNGFRPIQGAQPCAGSLPEGCVFGPRCPYFGPACGKEIPLRHVRGGRVRCIRAEDSGSAATATAGPEVETVPEGRPISTGDN